MASFVIAGVCPPPFNADGSVEAIALPPGYEENIWMAPPTEDSDYKAIVAQVSADSLYMTSIDLSVDDNGTTAHFPFHKELLECYSPVFQSMLEELPPTSGRAQLRVPEWDTETIDAFRQWLYIDFMRTGVVLNGHHHIKPRILNKLWIFAEAFQIPFLQNMTMYLLQRQAETGLLHPFPFESSEVSFVLKKTARGSKLRTWYLDQIAAGDLCETLMDPSFKDWDKDAMEELLQLLYTKEAPNAVARFKARMAQHCAYHVHAEHQKLSPGEMPRGTRHAAIWDYLAPANSAELPPFHWHFSKRYVPLDVFQSISCQPEYATKSFEELRLDDYDLGLREPHRDECGLIAGHNLAGLFNHRAAFAIQSRRPVWAR